MAGGIVVYPLLIQIVEYLNRNRTVYVVIGQVVTHFIMNGEALARLDSHQVSRLRSHGVYDDLKIRCEVVVKYRVGNHLLGDSFRSHQFHGIRSYKVLILYSSCAPGLLIVEIYRIAEHIRIIPVRSIHVIDQIHMLKLTVRVTEESSGIVKCHGHLTGIGVIEFYIFRAVGVRSIRSCAAVAPYDLAADSRLAACVVHESQRVCLYIYPCIRDLIQKFKCLPCRTGGGYISVRIKLNSVGYGLGVAVVGCNALKNGCLYVLLADVIAGVRFRDLLVPIVNVLARVILNTLKCSNRVGHCQRFLNLTIRRQGPDQLGIDLCSVIYINVIFEVLTRKLLDIIVYIGRCPGIMVGISRVAAIIIRISQILTCCKFRT